MRIELNDLVITSDKYQYVINKKTIAKSGQNKGEEVLIAQSYHPKLEQLAEKLLEMNVKKSDAQTLNDILTTIRATRQLIKKGMVDAL